jgi:cytochrome c-type biogenesis protein
MRSGILLLFAYSLGLGIPFLICSLALNTFLTAFQKARRYIGLFTKIGGALLILVGLLLLTNSFVWLNDWLSRWLPS